MKIEVKNSLPDVKVNINQKEEDSFEILLERVERKPIGSIKCGDIITIGRYDFIVLEQFNGATAIVAKNPIKFMPFGADGNYKTSDVRKYCNGEFYKELCGIVGKNNILSHIVDLTADDGSNKGATVKDNVSIITCELYRYYRGFIPAIGSACWTATRPTITNEAYGNYSCCIALGGVIDWFNSDFPRGVRPFLCLRSSVLI